MTTENDLGLQRTSSSTAYSPEDVALPHPAKLQHSPSLPNIRSPVDSTLDPLEMSIIKEKSQRPPVLHSPKPSTPIILADKGRSTRHVKYASIDPPSRKPSGHKTHARRRTDRDQPHSLLTPPLTPSSSIRTTASISTEYSVTSTAHSAHDAAKNAVAEDIVDPDPEATRILVLENVKSEVKCDTLKRALIDAFEKACAQSGLTINSNSLYDRPWPRDLLKGLNQGLQKSAGKVYALFYDARVAKIVTDFLRDTSAAASVFCDCVETRFGKGNRNLYPTVRLGSLDEIHRDFGPSEFLRNLDSSLSLSVRKSKPVDDGGGTLSLLKDVIEETSGETDSTGSGIDAAILLNILKPFGDIRSFKFSRQEVGQDLSSTCYYSVEYFDTQDCDAAWLDLDKKSTRYGLELKVSGNKLNPKPLPEVKDGAEYAIDAPAETDVTESFSNLDIGPPGITSQLRLPLFFGQVASSGGGPVSTPIVPEAMPQPSCGASSPPLFYVTSSGEAAQPPYQVMDPSDAGAQVPALPQQHPSNPFLDEHWNNDTHYRPGAVSPCFNPDGTGAYYSPHGALPGLPYPFGSFSTPPPATPVLFYPPRLQPTPQILPPHLPPWVFDPAVASVGPGGPPGMVPPPPMGGIMTGPSQSPAPFFIRDDGSGVPSGVGRAPQFPLGPFPPYAGGCPPAPFSPIAAQAPSSKPELVPASGAPVDAPGMSNMAAVAARAAVHDTSIPIYRVAKHQAAVDAVDGAASSTDKNTLYLDRIREGLDTRTTIMIKNIPNKMSDKDLTSYINKVCPRTIDFLYLRIDFKNGCNVGYAFVNFIEVEDLLRFADKCLGQRWNMFSSAKVLQMSYANYQSKESLIEKFKNSGIMDEPEEWRPRIFYSSGVNKGLPEPFPKPTHIRRKERSSHNRGTLYPSGMNSRSTGNHRGFVEATSNPRLPPVSVSSPFASVSARNTGGVKPLGFRGKRFL